MESSVDIDQAVIRKVFAASHVSGPGAVWLDKPQVVVANMSVGRDKDTGTCVFSIEKGPQKIRVHLFPEELRTFANDVLTFLADERPAL